MGQYRTSLRQWQQWRHQINEPLWLTQEQVQRDGGILAAEALAAFMAHCHEVLKHRADTVGAKLSAVSYFHKIEAGVELPISHFMLQAIKKGIRRRQGENNGNVRPVRRPLLWKDIESNKNSSVWQGFEASTVLWYGIAMSFMILARASELWADDTTRKIHTVYGLTRGDLTFHKQGVPVDWDRRSESDMVIISFRGSKGDQMRRGAQIHRFGKCLQVLLDLLSKYPDLPMSAALMTYKDSGDNWAVATRKTATRALRAMVARQQICRPEEFALHSGRIGAATQLAENGMSDSAIMAAGRWKSTAFMVYIRPSIGEAQRVSEVLGIVDQTNGKAGSSTGYPRVW